MTRAELDEVVKVATKDTGYCLCGHNESCSVCDGTYRAELKETAKRLEATFGPKVVG